MANSASWIVSFVTKARGRSLQHTLQANNWNPSTISKDGFFLYFTIVKETANINADKLIRLRPNRCIYAEPPQYQGNGRPKKHGEKMKLSDPETWAVPVESIEIDDPTCGVVKISRWNRFHFEQSADYPMSIILVQPQGKKLSQRSTTPMWLAWIGEE